MRVAKSVAFADWTELVGHAEVDAMAIATPSMRWGPVEFNKPLFIEKPLAQMLKARVACAGPYGKPIMAGRAEAQISDGACPVIRAEPDMIDDGSS